jgi:RNA recognition motif-containing protein
MEVKLYVGNLASSTTEQELRLLFSQAGTVTAVNLVQDQESGRSKGIAFVTMSTQAEAQAAISLFNAFSLADCKLRVIAARLSAPSTSHQSRLSAFGPGGQSPKLNTSKAPGAQGGYRSQLGAFGTTDRPAGPRRRGRSQRY